MDTMMKDFKYGCQVATHRTACMYALLQKKRMKRGSEELMNLGCVLKSDVTLVGQFYMNL